MTRALVLAGGGVAGIAWETGVLLGLRDAGTDLLGADAVIGTSAGAAVGAQLLSGTDLEELYARQVSPDHQELTPALDLDKLVAFFTEVGDLTQGVDPATLRKMGAFALEVQTVPLADRRAVVEWRLPSHAWPERLQVTAVDTATGELIVLDRSSGVPLVEAVMASCAVPGVWPPVPLQGRVLMDGGVRSTTNMDLAAGHDEVVVLVPMGAGPMRAVVEAEAARLTEAGARVRLVLADEATVTAMGPNPLDPSTRPACAEAGRVQGRQAFQARQA
jgi:NTE family protein